MMRLLAEAFEAHHPGVQVIVAPSLGSSGAIQATAKDALDLGLISREMTPAEKGLQLETVEYARTPFVLAVGTRVPITDLQALDLARIYRGESTHWPNGERIRLILRPSADADTLLVRSLSPEMSLAIDAALARPGLLMALTNQEALEMILKTPGTIGFCSLSQILSEKAPVKILSLGGVAPTLQAVRTGTYPLSLKHAVVVRQDRTRTTRDFLEFVLSEEGRSLLRQYGNLSPSSSDWK
jgi:phosphate transport system substrate-binding protein